MELCEALGSVFGAIGRKGRGKERGTGKSKRTTGLNEGQEVQCWSQRGGGRTASTGPVAGHRLWGKLSGDRTFQGF